jgi:class 3 adenylate cyclase
LAAPTTSAKTHHLQGIRRDERAPDRVFAPVMFTDIVDSTPRAAAMGDRRWSELLEGHHRVVRQQLQRFGGQEIKTTGDGFLTTFDGPARAIRCALSTSEATHEIGLPLRAALTPANASDDTVTSAASPSTSARA